MFGEMQLAERVGFETGVRAVPIQELARYMPVLPERLLVYTRVMVRRCGAALLDASTSGSASHSGIDQNASWRRRSASRLITAVMRSSARPPSGVRLRVSVARDAWRQAALFSATP